MERPHKYACVRCINGHRSGNCKHFERPRQLIRPKGRPPKLCDFCKHNRIAKSGTGKCECSRRPKATKGKKSNRCNDCNHSPCECSGPSRSMAVNTGETSINPAPTGERFLAPAASAKSYPWFRKPRVSSNASATEHSESRKFESVLGSSSVLAVPSQQDLRPLIPPSQTYQGHVQNVALPYAAHAGHFPGNLHATLYSGQNIQVASDAEATHHSGHDMQVPHGPMLFYSGVMSYARVSMPSPSGTSLCPGHVVSDTGSSMSYLHGATQYSRGVMQYPTGATLHPDGSMLYTCESLPQRAQPELYLDTQVPSIASPMTPTPTRVRQYQIPTRRASNGTKQSPYAASTYCTQGSVSHEYQWASRPSEGCIAENMDPDVNSILYDFPDDAVPWTSDTSTTKQVNGTTDSSPYGATCDEDVYRYVNGAAL